MGGNTAFLDLEESEKIEVEPRTGMLILKYKFDLTYYANTTIKKIINQCEIESEKNICLLCDNTFLGSVLIYQHDILHEDSAVLSGRKYALRTDVMYSADKVEDEKELRRLRKNDKGKFGMFM